MKQIGVLVSAGVHPITGVARYARNDALALSMGLQLADSHAAQMAIFYAGDPENVALAEYLALGAPCVQVIPTNADDDLVQNLAAQLSKSDLIITGSRAESGESSGLLAYLLAEKLGIPLVANALAIKPKDNGVEVLQFLPKGKRRRIQLTLPAIVAVHTLAPVELKYAHARILTGELAVLPQGNKNSNLKSMACNEIPTTHKPAKLKAADKKYGIHKTGHARMTEALVSESKGGLVVIGQNSVEKAQVILGYLREHHLINF